MTIPIRAARLAGLAMIAALLAAACSDASTSSDAGDQPSGTEPPTSSTPGPALPGGTGDWLTYHRSAARDGAGPASPATVPSRVRIAWTGTTLDGAVYAEPLVDAGRVVVGTERGTLYGLDSRGGAVLWSRHLADPVTGGLECGDILPLGITGTPAIDPATHTAYAVAEKRNGEHLLAAVDDRTGAFLWERIIDPPGSDAPVQQQRAALAVANGRVYVALGGLFGDCGGYRGWVVGVGLDGGGPLLAYRVPGERGAGIWAPSGIAVAADGSLYVAMGNGFSTGAYDHGDAVIRLDPGLRETGFAAPSDWAALNADDTDLGSTGPLLLPGGLIAVAGKDGALHVFASDHLAGIGAELSATALGGAAFGGMAAEGRRVFVPGSDALRAADVDASGHVTLAWSSHALRVPIVAFGEVWAVDPAPGGRLRALDPATGREVASVAVGPTVTFTTPGAGAGLVLVAATDHVVAVAPA